jgi:pimeloyl-ACP methyl ester carboxylesterase
VISADGSRVSYERSGSGEPLLLVHGAFSDHHTNWELVTPSLRERFTVCPIARRGRGETDATRGHALEDEARDVVALVEAVGRAEKPSSPPAQLTSPTTAAAPT